MATSFMTPQVSVSGGLGKAVLDADPRLKLALALAFGVLVWRSGPMGLAVQAILIAPFFLALGGLRAVAGRAVLGFTLFALFWSGAAGLVGLWEGLTQAQAWSRAGLLGFRLLILFLAGMTLAMAASPRRYGLALAWLLRPVLGKHAWKAALALALMVHFLPLSWVALAQARTSVRLARPHGSRARRLVLMAACALRAMAAKAEGQTLAIAARGLDSPEAWRGPLASSPLHYLAGILLALAAFLAAYVS